MIFDWQIVHLPSAKALNIRYELALSMRKAEALF